MRRRIVVGLGEILWDIIGQEKHLGGAPANFAYHAAALGDHGAVVSRVGSDPLGREILDTLRALGTPTEYVQVDRRLPTGTVTVKLDRAGQPDFTITPNVAWDNIRPTDALMRLARRADAVCYGSLAQRCATSRNTIRKFLAAAKKAVHVCDINLRAEFASVMPDEAGLVEILAGSIAAADVLKLNNDELWVLCEAFGRTKDDDPFTCWLLREFKLRMVCVTMGAQGCVVRTARRRVISPGVKVKVADTVGSGDAFTAAMVNRLLRKRPLDEVAAFANRMGAFVASKPGATPPAEEG